MATGSYGIPTGETGSAVNNGAYSSGGSLSGRDPMAGMTGDQRDAYAAIMNMLTPWGLGDLGNDVWNMIQNGMGSDAISLELQQTAAYKKRFAANDARAKAGLPVLAPAEYLSVEKSYRDVLSAAGLPSGFYDQASDFTNWIANGVSPTEIQGRVNVASQLVNSSDPQTKAYFQQWYSHGDMIAYALDRDRAEPLLEQQFKAAQNAGAAKGQGVDINQSRAEQLANLGVTQAQAQQGFGVVAQGNARRGVLDAIYGDTLTQDDLINEALLNDGQAGLKRGALASKERAAFNGTSGAGAQSISKTDAGRL